ncbi:hypothetical protein, partial [Nocardia carnea]|uniref:hypothetical protein n=1 Tax=Nocardia carnea TaxID=37328 RepID=UPI002455FABB
SCLFRGFAGLGGGFGNDEGLQKPTDGGLVCHGRLCQTFEQVDPAARHLGMQLGLGEIADPAYRMRGGSGSS